MVLLYAINRRSISYLDEGNDPVPTQFDGSSTQVYVSLGPSNHVIKDTVKQSIYEDLATLE